MNDRPFVQTDPLRFASILVDDSAEWDSAAELIKARDAALVADKLREAVLEGLVGLQDMWTIYVAALGAVQTHDAEAYERLSENGKRVYSEAAKKLYALLPPT